MLLLTRMIDLPRRTFSSRTNLPFMPSSVYPELFFDIDNQFPITSCLPKPRSGGGNPFLA